MYLSRLILNPRSRAVRRDLADCQAQHRTIMSAFPQVSSGEQARVSLGVLYRLDTHPQSGRMALLVQSRTAPDWSRLEPGYLLDTGGDPENPACKSVDEQYGRLQAGMELLFRLRANPTRKIDTRSGPDGQRRNGKRVELREEAAQLDWLRRKGEQAGFTLVSARANGSLANARAMPGDKLVGKRPDGEAGRAPGRTAELTFASVLFEGALRVTDADTFRRALEQGVGSAKAYGFGLLSVARPRGAPW